MKVCLNCHLANNDDTQYCLECGKNEFEPINSAVNVRYSNSPQIEKKSISIFGLAIIIGAIHFFVSLMLLMMLMAGAASGLSDAPHHGDSSQGDFLASALAILQAPVALAQWIAIKCHPDTHTGLPIRLLIFFAMIWSVVFGVLAAKLYGKIK